MTQPLPLAGPTPAPGSDHRRLPDAIATFHQARSRTGTLATTSAFHNEMERPVVRACHMRHAAEEKALPCCPRAMVPPGIPDGGPQADGQREDEAKPQEKQEAQCRQEEVVDYRAEYGADHRLVPLAGLGNVLRMKAGMDDPASLAHDRIMPAPVEGRVTLLELIVVVIDQGGGPARAPRGSPPGQHRQPSSSPFAPSPPRYCHWCHTRAGPSHHKTTSPPHTPDALPHVCAPLLCSWDERGPHDSSRASDACLSRIDRRGSGKMTLNDEQTAEKTLPGIPDTSPVPPERGL
jgi:hypothetical protein